MRALHHRFFALTLPLTLLLAGGCLGTSGKTGVRPKYVPISPTPRGQTVAAASPKNGLNNLRNPSPTPTPSMTPRPASPVPSKTPVATPTIANFPVITAQPVAINEAAGGGVGEGTLNFVVVSGANTTADGSFKIAATTSNSLASVPEPRAAFKTLSHSRDRHAAWRQWEAERVTPALPGRTSSYQVQQAAGTLAKGAPLDFYVITTFDEAGYEDVGVKARVAEVGRHCYVMVDEDINDNPAHAALMEQRAKAIAATFDDTIYPTNTRLFGSEPNPGVDKDPRVFILISPAVGNYGADNTLGFFSQRDEFVPKADSPAMFKHSNAKELLYVSSRIVLTGSTDDYFGTIAHEFQHMINFNQKVLVGKNRSSDDLWIDEGMAMYAIEANGYGLREGGQVLANHVKKFQQEPGSYSLTDWNDNPDASGYGPVYLFMVYLADRFSESIMKEIVTTKAVGSPNLDAVLATRGTSFNRVFHDWSMANLMDGHPQTTNPHHQYALLDMHGINGATRLNGFATERLAFPGSDRLTLRPYSMRIYELPDGPLTPKFTLTSSGDAGVVPRVVVP